MSQTVDRFVKQGFRSAAPYNAEHHDFAWQHRQLARMMSNECPIPPSEGVRAAVREAFDIGHLYPYSGKDLVAAWRSTTPCRRSRSSWATVQRKCSTSWCGCWSARATRRSSRRPPTRSSRARRASTAASRKPVPLTPSWDLDVEAMLGAVTDRTTIIFLCSPNNPTGKGWRREQLIRLLDTGIPVVVDQAYLECGYAESFAPLVARPHEPRHRADHVEGVRAGGVARRLS